MEWLCALLKGPKDGEPDRRHPREEDPLGNNNEELDRALALSLAEDAENPKGSKRVLLIRSSRQRGFTGCQAFHKVVHCWASKKFMTGCWKVLRVQKCHSIVQTNGKGDEVDQRKGNVCSSETSLSFPDKSHEGSDDEIDLDALAIALEQAATLASNSKKQNKSKCSNAPIKCPVGKEKADDPSLPGEHLVDKLDSDFAMLAQTKALLSLTRSAKADANKNSSSIVQKDSFGLTAKEIFNKEKPDAYDKLVKEMVMDQRARPSDRTKTPEEIAQEEKERLEKLEALIMILTEKGHK
ncbi:hypothetical protein ABZP36_034790 [Zizania latifolia]